MKNFDDYRKQVIHRVFTGVNIDNFDFVGDALAEFEIFVYREGFFKGFFHGCIIGMFLGTIGGFVLSSFLIH